MVGIVFQKLICQYQLNTPRRADNLMHGSNDELSIKFFNFDFIKFEVDNGDS